MKFRHALIAYNRNSDEIIVRNRLSESRYGWADGYRMTTGAAYTKVREMNGILARHRVMSEFIGIIVRDGVDLKAAYRAFWDIEDFRNALPVDMPIPNPKDTQ